MIYNVKANDFSIKKGPVFANFVLADEINRAPAKVQSALLEAMQERQVTIGETTFKLDEPFLVMATQNPVEQEGTYPLAREVVREVYMDEKIEKYILDIVFATRFPEKYGLPELKGLISFGASPRGSINLGIAAKCYAFIKRRGYVVPEDVRAVIMDVLRHRIGITYEAEAENMTSEDIIEKIVNTVEVP